MMHWGQHKEELESLHSGPRLEYLAYSALSYPGTGDNTSFSQAEQGMVVSIEAYSAAMLRAVQNVLVLWRREKEEIGGHIRLGNAPIRPTKALDLGWISLAQSGPESSGIDKMERVIDGLSAVLRADHLDIVDKAYEQVEVKEMSLEMLMVFLRIPYVRRGELANWKPFLEKVRAEGKRRGIKDKNFLKGLI